MMSNLDLDREVARLSDRLVGVSGLIHSLSHIRSVSGQPRLHNVSCVKASTKHIFGVDIPGATGAAGLTASDALIGAIGETVERYCGASIHWPDLVHASKEELGAAAAGLDEFPQYADWQYDIPGFPVARWDPRQKIYWAKGVSLLSGETRYVPAPLVYIPYLYRDAEHKSDFIAIGTSTGQACHSDPDLAVLSGLCECIERDAFMISWMRRLSLPRVDYMADPVMAAQFERHYAGCNVDFQVIDMTLDLETPSYMCIARGMTPRGVINSVGCATRPSAREACSKAMLESAQTLAWARYLVDSKPDWRPTPGYGNLLSFEDHVRLYCEPDMSPSLDYLFKSPEIRPLRPEPPAEESTAQAISRIIGQVAQAGQDVIKIDLTTREIEDLGLHVPKLFITGSPPLNAVHTMPPLASPRFYTVPEALGRWPDLEPGFSDVPHPFP